MMTSRRTDVLRHTLAWLAHLYTATGFVFAAGIAVLIVRGDDASFRLAFLLMIAATGVDATDGWLARRARVKELTPQFSGRSLDDLIDFHTYTSLPLLLIWRAGILPGSLAWLLLLPLLASAYGFSQVDAKTDDGFFLGFPSYWNIVAFYLYLLHSNVWIAVALIVALSILTFVRTPYIYATQGGPFAKTINIGSAVWTALIVWILWAQPAAETLLTTISLGFPLLYLVLSAVVTGRRRAAVRNPSDRRLY
jgi:phosphatidylcholine synthase